MLIVFDLEATCWGDEEKNPQNISEIIQIGAVKLDLYNSKIVDQFEMLVRPKLSKELSGYCINLTGIKTHEVRAAEYFEQVYPKFVRFCGSRHNNSLVAWGDFDEKALKVECGRNNLSWDLPTRYINASFLYKEFFGGKKRSLIRAVNECGLAFTGEQHNALFDALNTARVFAHIFGKKLTFNFEEV